MGVQIIEGQPVIEAGEFRDIFCCGLHRIEFIGPCARFVLHADGPRAADGTFSRVVLSDAVVAPVEAIVPAARMMVGAVSQRWGRSAVGLLMPH